MTDIRYKCEECRGIASAKEMRRVRRVTGEKSFELICWAGHVTQFD